MKEKLGINVFAFSCEGYKGVSQSAGHHIANNQLFKHVIGRDDTPPEGKFRINLLGEYNIGGDAFLIEELLERCGITLVATFSGNSTIDQFEQRPHGGPELRDVPPLDQLRGRHDREEVRHAVDQGQLHRRRGHRPSRSARSPTTSTTRS